MNFNDLLDAQKTNECRGSPAVKHLVVRALMGVLQTNDSEDGLLSGSHRRVVSELLERHAGLAGDETHSPVNVLLENCRVVEQELATAAEVDATDPILQLSRELGEALRLSGVDLALLTLSLYANVNRDVERAFSMAADLDDEMAGAIFAFVLKQEPFEVIAALRKENPLRKMSSFEVCHERASAFAFLRFNRAVQAVLRNGKPSIEAILGMFFRCAPPPRLQLSDFDDKAKQVSLMTRFLANALGAGREGVNILIYGSPGTGKTELTRAMACSLGVQLMEVPTVDEDKDPLPPWRRLTTYCAAQEALRMRPSTIMLFDEMEDVFPAGGESGYFHGRRSRGSSDRTKGWVTQVLESNARPTFWLSNRIDQVDPAYLRRFDMVVELTKPGRDARERMVDQLFCDIPVTAEHLARLNRETDLAPGHLERMAGVLRTLAPANEAESGEMLDMLTQQVLQSMALRPRRSVSSGLLPYRPECVNASIDLTALTAALQDLPVARLCLYGPPGTGKTEWARQLAHQLGRPLHVKRASDLLGKYVGETEKQIREAFAAAESDGAVLVIDEADSLLRSRLEVQHGWETSMVNEMLTSMEDFQGLFIASTNLVTQLDAASARRFDFKVEFDFLRQTQLPLLFADLLAGLGVKANIDIEPGTFSGMSQLTPGDFANVMRQARLTPTCRTVEGLVSLLRQEQGFRTRESTKKRIGFV